MLVLIFAILCFVSIFILFRYFEKWKVDNMQAIVVNYLVASILSFLLYNGDISFSDALKQAWFIPSLILGVLFMVSFYLYALSAQRSGVALTAVASKMSVVIPVILGSIIYTNENLNALKWIGLGLSLISFYLIFKSKKGSNINVKLLILPTIIFFAAGANDTLMRWIKVHYSIGNGNNFNEEIYFVAILFSISFLTSLFFIAGQAITNPRPIHWQSIGAGALLGVLNVLSATSMFVAMGKFESAFFFPVFNVSIVSLSALSGILLFREKLSTVNLIGIALALITISIIAYA